MIDKVWVQMEREQQEELLVWVWAIMVMQGGRMPGPSTAVAGSAPRACKCTLQLGVPEGCLVSERGKAWACLPCQKACKVCVWPLGLAEATVVMGSGMEGSRKPVLKHMVKWRMRTMMNMLP